MTLLTNEIHVAGSLQQSTIIFAADRRITLLGKFHSLGKKIFRIPYLSAGVGYFGLAEVFPKGKRQSMSSWLPQFIALNSGITSLGDFADALRFELDKVVPDPIKVSNPSGFHISGFNKTHMPEFWFVRNILNMNAHTYINFQNHYFISEDFLRRDARKFGYNGNSPNITQPFLWIYRNGDIRAHVVAWEKLDRIMSDFLALPDFKKLKSISDYEEFVKFKMTLIASVYKKYAKASTIGTPIDVFSIR